MSKAYIIEVYNRTAGIVTAEGRGVRFFSADRAFDRLEGQTFGCAREAERAARTLFGNVRCLQSGQRLLTNLD
jgi:hypothetical protein